MGMDTLELFFNYPRTYMVYQGVCSVTEVATGMEGVAGFGSNSTTDVLNNNSSGYAHRDDDDDEYIRPALGCYAIFCSFIFFALVDRLIPLVLNPPKYILNDAQESGSNFDRWKWKNLCISFIHATISGTWALSNFVLYPEFMYDLIGHYTYWAYFMVCFSVGYFMYDSLDMKSNGVMSKFWELTVHHMVIIFMMCWNLYDCQRIGWNIIALSPEVNSIFLHTRKLMQTYSVRRNSVAYRATIFLNFLTFSVFRIFTGFVVAIGTMIQYKQVSVSYCIAVICMQIVLNTINPILLWRLIKSDILLPKKSTDSQNNNSSITSDNNQSHARSNSMNKISVEMNGSTVTNDDFSSSIQKKHV